MPDSLLRRIGTGDTSAIDEVLERYGGLVWSLARRYCANPADAEDATQEVFIDLWQSAHRYDEAVASEVTFVAMIARRRLIDRSRRSDRRPSAESLPADLAAIDIGQEHVELGEEVARIAQAMSSLRPEQQQVLNMSIYDGLSHDEIARSTGLPVGTVKTHARRGLMRLRELVGAVARSGARGTSP